MYVCIHIGYYIITRWVFALVNAYLDIVRIILFATALVVVLD